jgi:hypothetical protein
MKTIFALLSVLVLVTLTGCENPPKDFQDASFVPAPNLPPATVNSPAMNNHPDLTNTNL